jgi:leucyl/phenylalanyl-tRNA--protein transferase
MRDNALDPDDVLWAYRQGAFPMADGRRGRVRWYRPDPRALLPLDERFRVRRSLAKRVRSGRFEITRDRAFERVIRACAEPRPGHTETWINGTIIDVYCELHRRGFAHSVEAWRGDELVGGLYGVAIGAAFFGESMFSRESDASQVCLVHLVEHLRARGYMLLDVQFTNPHLEQFGVIEVRCGEYLRHLTKAAVMPVSWEPGRS